jgi:hypothetical protein
VPEEGDDLGDARRLDPEHVEPHRQERLARSFFGDEQVQAGGAMIFESRDPTVWLRATDIRSFTLPVPAGKDARCVGLIRGLARSREAARAAFDALVAGSINAARMAGQISLIRRSARPPHLTRS